MSEQWELEQANQILSEACAKALNERDQWREVAGRLAEQLKACDRFICGTEDHFIGLCAIADAIAAYDALAKSLSDGGKG